MKLFKRISCLFIIIVGAFLLSACTSHKEDKERLVRYLNNVYGENAYEMKEDPRHPYLLVCDIEGLSRYSLYL